MNLRRLPLEARLPPNSRSPHQETPVQPYYAAANVHRFDVPEGVLTFSLEWQRDRAAFRTKRGAALVSERVFTASVPSPGIESMRVAFYVYRDSEVKLEHPMEAVIERFTYFP